MVSIRFALRNKKKNAEKPRFTYRIDFFGPSNTNGLDTQLLLYCSLGDLKAAKKKICNQQSLRPIGGRLRGDSGNTSLTLTFRDGSRSAQGIHNTAIEFGLQ